MNREEYDKFLELQGIYEKEKEKISGYFRTIISRYHWTTLPINARYMQTFDDIDNFQDSYVVYTTSGGCGTDYESLRVDDLLSKEWLDELNTKVAKKHSQLKEHERENNEREISKLEKALEELKKLKDQYP